MGAYPDTVHFRGLNTPTGIEASAHDLRVEGTIPAEIDGAFFRAVPDPAFPPIRQDDVILSADGMINKIEFRGGRVSYAIRYVHTERFLAERRAGRALFGRYRNPFTNDPAAAGVDGTVANTTPVWHAGRLFMTKEDGRAYQIDPHTLDTVGKWDWDGAFRSQTMTAHPRVDPRTGEMFFFGYEADGLCSSKIAYCIADADGALVSEQWFDAPYCSFMHDFGLTDEHVVFMVFPTTADLDRLKAGGPHWLHEQERESWIGIMPRHGDVSELTWFKGPAGVHAYHVMNAFTEGRLVHLDMCLANTNLIPFIVEDPGLEVPLDGGLTRWTMNLDDPEAGISERRFGPFGEMPLTVRVDQGRAYRHGWYLTVDPSKGKPLHNGPAGIAFNCILRVNLGNGGIEGYSIGPDLAINEPVHIPSATGGHEGWLMAVVDHEFAAGRYDQQVWIWEAGDLEKGPVAKVHLPVTTREQVHGGWVSRRDLDAARIRAAAR
ncbi:carotenoid oxygenase family protein [Sphingomonas hankookensis]|uniref:carotenoid oxygenase family protein n=1 Tax=Sphingomonas hankookensis TaxID=563996 RepID=UPI003F796D29